MPAKPRRVSFHIQVEYETVGTTRAMNLADLFISPKDPATGGFYAPLVLHLAVSPGHSCQALDSGPSSRLTRLAAWSVQPRVGHPTLSLRCRQVKRPFEGPLRILACADAMSPVGLQSGCLAVPCLLHPRSELDRRWPTVICVRDFRIECLLVYPSPFARTTELQQTIRLAR
jgi:hypothetical protein